MSIEKAGRTPTPSSQLTGDVSATPGKSSLTEGRDGETAESLGQPLPTNQRSLFERSLGTDLSGVRVHDGDAADAQAKKHDARAFAQGQNIYMGKGELDPNDPEKNRMLAHEVAHTVQQRGSLVAPGAAVPTTTPGDAAERNADDAAGAMLDGRPAQVDAFPASIARQTPGEKKKPTKIPIDQGVKGAFSGFDAGGNVKATMQKNGVVHVTSTEVRIRGDFTANVNKLEELFGTAEEPFGDITAGAIQNVTSSNRTGIYRRPDGSVVATRVGKLGRMHDQMTKPDDKPGVNTPFVGKDGGPWYQTPVTLNKTSQAHSGVKLVYDQPSFNLEAKVGDAVLDEIQGEDKFVTSMAAKRGSETAYLASESWSVPWNMKLDKKTQEAIGGEVKHAPTKDKANIVDGKLPVNEKDAFAFASEAEALAAPRQMLLETLAVQRTNDPVSYGYAVSAIRKLNWSFEIDVKCASKYGMLLDDEMTLTVTGSKTVSTPLKMARGDLKGLSFRFLDVFDPESFSHDTPLKIVLSGEGKTLNFKAWSPFPHGELKGGDDHYTAKMFG